jgi:hypothetical protein
MLFNNFPFGSLIYALVKSIFSQEQVEEGPPAPPVGTSVRITEDNIVRITEDGNRRITE